MFLSSLQRVLSLAVIVCFSSLAIADSHDSQGEMIITNISQGVFQHTSYFKTDSFGLVSSNGLIVVQDKDAYLVDTPWTQQDTVKLVQWITNQGLTLKASISTHSHDDRTAGIAYLNSQGITTHVSEQTNQILTEQHKAQANSAFKGNRFSFANGLIEVQYLGAGHTLDNLVVWLPKSHILFGGCLVKSAASKSMGYIAEASLTDWPTTLANVKTAYPNAEIVVPGHGEIGTIELLDHTKTLVTDHLAK